MEDVTALLVACSKEPLRLRADGGELFSKACEEIHSGMVALPEWYSKFAGFTPDRDVDCIHVPPRIERAFDLALELKFTKRSRNDERKDALIATSLGMDWLAKSAKERLKDLLDFVRIPAPGAPRKRRPAPEFLEDSDFAYRSAEEEFFTRRFIWGEALGSYWPVNWHHETHELKIKQALAAAFGSLATGSFYGLDRFLVYHTEAANPLHALLRESPNGQKPRFNYAVFGLNEDLLERIWAATLLDVFWRWLAPFGGVLLAANADGWTPEFSLTGAGRYLLGLAADFESPLTPQRRVRWCSSPILNSCFWRRDPPW